jgi:hypothetical protein
MRFDNRQHSRQPVHIAARLASGPDVPQHKCVVVDISDTGARLEVATIADIPDKFTMLLTPRGQPYRLCEVVWRGSRQIGVAFDKKAPDSPRDV